MKRKLIGKCPYSPDLLPCLEDILDKATRFRGDLQAVIRVVYLCKREEDLERYKDFSLIREESIQKRLKPLLIEAYRKYTPENARGAFLEAILYQEIRRLHSGNFEISRWALYGDVSPVCPSCAAKSIDVFEQTIALRLRWSARLALRAGCSTWTQRRTTTWCVWRHLDAGMQSMLYG